MSLGGARGLSLFGVSCRTQLRALAVVGAAAALGACSIFGGGGPAPETLALNARVEIAELPGSTTAQLLVPESVGLQVFDSERIVVTTGPVVSYYPEAQFPDRLPRMVQAKVIEAFEQSGRVRSVGRPGQGLSIDYQILTDIRAFEFATAEGLAKVEISAKLMDDRNGRVVASRVFSTAAPVPENTAVAVVAAMDVALQQVLADMVRWTLTRL